MVIVMGVIGAILGASAPERGARRAKSARKQRREHWLGIWEPSEGLDSSARSRCGGKVQRREEEGSWLTGREPIGIPETTALVYIYCLDAADPEIYSIYFCLTPFVCEYNNMSGFWQHLSGPETRHTVHIYVCCCIHGKLGFYAKIQIILGQCSEILH